MLIENAQVKVYDDGTVRDANIASPIGGIPLVYVMDIPVPLDVLVLDTHCAKFSKLIKKTCVIPLITHADGDMRNCSYANLSWERLEDVSRARDARAVARVLYLNWELGSGADSPPGRRAQCMAGDESF
jgi:hypothetical protein